MKKLCALLIALAALTGSYAQSVSFSTDSLSGNAPVSQTTHLTFTTSSSISGVTIDSIYVTGGNKNMFIRPEVAQGTALSATPVEFEIAYTPSDTGMHYADLNIAYSDNGSAATYVIKLTGHGDYKKLYFPWTHTFGTVEYKSLNNDFAIPVKAVGGMDVTITEVDVVCCGDVIWLEQELPIIAPADGTPVNLTFRVNPVSVIGMTDADIQVTNDGVYPELANLVSYNVVGPEPAVNVSQIEMTVSRMDYKDTVITISNEGTLPYDITDVYLLGVDQNHYDIVDAPSFPYTVAPGASTTLTVRFQPTAIPDNEQDRFYSALSIQTEVNSLPVYLLCYVNSPQLEVNYPNRGFGFLETGVETKDGTVTIKNTGNEDLVVTDISFVESQTVFTMTPPSLPLTLTPGATSDILFSAAPVIEGRSSAKYTISSNSLYSIDTFNLAVDAVSSKVQIDPIDMGKIAINETSPNVPVKINNIGGHDLTITDVTITGPDAALISIVDLNLPLTIKGTVWQNFASTFHMNFTPVAEGVFNAQLNITSNSSGSVDVIPITGEGILSPKFYSDSTIFNFGVAGIGTDKALAYPIQNSGSAPLIISNATTKYSTNTFYADTASLPRTILPGDTIHLMLHFTPFNNQYRSGEISIYTNDVRNDTVTLPVYGNGESGKLTFSSSSVNFSNLYAGSERDTISITITNEGLGNAYLRYRGHNSDDEFYYYFPGVPDPSPFPKYDTLIASGQSMEMKVICNPKSIGNNSDSLLIEMPFNIGWTATKKYIPVSYHGEVPPNVKVGGMLFEADNITVNGDIRTLSGNVRSGDMYFTGDVTIDLATNEISGEGDVYTKNVAQQGIFGGTEVKLAVGGYSYSVDPLEPKLVQKAGLVAANAGFKLVGLPLSISRFDLLPNGEGMIVGGKVKLPEATFGNAAYIIIDSMYISNDGIKVVGQAALNPDLKVFNTFQLKNAKVKFNTFENYFSGGAVIGVDLMGKGVTIGAGVVIKNSGLDSLGLEIEVSPGIPIGSTGLALAGGNGFIDGLQVGPIAIGLGIDIIPAIPGPETVRLNNVGVSYTFGTSLEASGTLQLFGENIAGAKYYASTTRTSLEMFVNLLNFFKGNANIIITTEGGGMQVEGGATLAVVIPKEVPGCSVCGAFKFALPYTLASASAYFKDDIVKANVTIAEVFTVGAAVRFKDGKAELLVGENYENLNASAVPSTRSSKMAESGISFENDKVLMAKNRLEGQSILFNPSYAKQSAKTTETSGTTDFHFTIASQQDHIIIRLTGTSLTPEYSVVLPNGIEINETNASDYGHIYNPDHDMLQSFYTIVNALPGAYKLIIDDSEAVEIDFFGAEFGPELQIKNVVSTANNVVTITWQDADLDSDAKISFFYDTDKNDANGTPIVRDLSEDDETDSYSWYAEDLNPGDYYIYGVINDGRNAPIPVYFDTPITINGISIIQAPTLDTPVQDEDTITLSWNKVSGANRYVIYYDEAAVTSGSPNFSAGDTIQYSFSGLTPGRTYHFVVTALDEEFNESDFSNEVVLNYSSPINNAPEITTTDFPKKVYVGETYAVTVNYTDMDATDALTLSLTEVPAGMILNSDQISWTPDNSQVGQHKVQLLLTDNKGAKDSVTFYITVFDELSSKGVITTSGYQFHGANQEVSVTLNDPDLNANESSVNTGIITLTSGFEKTGIVIEVVETGINTGVFQGKFSFRAAESNSAKNIIGTMEADTILISYEDAKPSVTVTKRVIYEAGETLNNLPSAVMLDNQSIQLNTNMGDLIGILSTTDADADDTHTFTFVTGVGDESNDLFFIDGAALKADMDFSNATEPYYNVRIRSTDSKGGFYEKTFALKNEAVTGVNDEALSTRINLYPNPTSKKVFVSVEGANQGDLVINIVSLTGQILLTKDFHKNAYQAEMGVNISRLEEGIYFVQIIQNGEVVNKRLIKK